MRSERKLVRVVVVVTLVLMSSATILACGDRSETLAGGPPTTEGSPMVPLCADVEPEPQPDGPLSSDPEVARQQKIRATLGLRTDEEWTRSVIDGTVDDPVPPGTPSALGLMDGVSGAKITPHESVTLSLSGDPVASSVLSDYGRQFASTFGGMWLDNTTHSFVVAFTADVDARRIEIAALTATPANLPGGIDPSRTPTTAIGELPNRVQVIEVARTEAALIALAERISAYGQADGQTLAITGTGPDITWNLVGVGLEDPTDAARATLARSFGSTELCVRQQGRGQTLAG